MSIDSSASAAAAAQQRAAAAAAEAARRAEAAAREAARRAEQAQEQARAQAKPVRAPAVDHTSRYEPARRPPVELHPSPGEPVSPAPAPWKFPGVSAAKAKPAVSPAEAQAAAVWSRAKFVDAIPNHPYVYGGGHGAAITGSVAQQTAAFQNGVDCSGAVSYALGLKTPVTSGTLEGMGTPIGDGVAGANSKANVVVFANSEHTFMRLRDPKTGEERYWGTSGFARPEGSGAGWFNQTPSDSYLSGFKAVSFDGQLAGLRAPDGSTPSAQAGVSAAQLKKIVPDMDPAQARKVAPFVQTAMQQAGIEDGKEQAAFIAMAATGTHNFEDPAASTRFVVDAAKQWKAENLGAEVKDGAGLTRIAKQLGIPEAQGAAGSSKQEINNPEDFARVLLDKLHAPQTPENINSLVNWQALEGGQWHNSASFNPLNTTLDAPGATPMNSVGVKAYGSWEQGVKATVETLTNGQYADIGQALRAGKGLVGDIAGLRTWSGGGYGRVPTTPSTYGSTTGGPDGGTVSMGPPQIGEGIYQRAIHVFGLDTPPPGSDASTSTSSGATSSGGVSGTPSSGASAGPVTQPANDGTAAVQTPELQSLQRQTQSLGYDIGDQMLWGILQMLNDSYGAMIGTLSGDPDFQAFVRSQPGMKNWKPGQPVPKAMMAAFLAKKMKSHGVKAGQNGVLVDKKGNALNGWQDVSKALGIKGAAPAVAPATPVGSDAAQASDLAAQPQTLADPSAELQADPEASLPPPFVIGEPPPTPARIIRG